MCQFPTKDEQCSYLLISAKTSLGLNEQSNQSIFCKQPDFQSIQTCLITILPISTTLDSFSIYLLYIVTWYCRVSYSLWVSERFREYAFSFQNFGFLFQNCWLHQLNKSDYFNVIWCNFKIHCCFHHCL